MKTLDSNLKGETISVLGREVDVKRVGNPAIREILAGLKNRDARPQRYYGCACITLEPSDEYKPLQAYCLKHAA